jgi:tetratricopeptide (TPR) repeat protein
MKKLSILVIATLMAASSFAQSIAVQTAFNHHKKGKLKEALGAIQPALENSQTATQAKTWFYYANICLDIAQDATGAYNGVLANPLDEATRGYVKALELDKKEDYKDDIISRIGGISGLYSDKGVTAYEAKSYSEAAGNFTKAYELTELLNRPNMNMLRYSGTCWLDAKNWDKAEAVYTKLKDANYKDASIYTGLAKIAVERKELNKAVKYLDEGEEKYPTDLGFLSEKANMYLVGELSELDKHAALNTLKKIIAVEPNNASVWNSLGACYALDSTKFDEAVAAYKKCIELDPKFTSAYYGYSNLYLDKANVFIKEANDLPLSAAKEYDALIKKAEDIFTEVLPFVEQAHTLDPSDAGVKLILKEIYTRLKMMDKAAGVK